MKLVGYDDEKKGYRLYDKTTEKVQVHRDVTFDESTIFTEKPPPRIEEIEYAIERILDQRIVDGKVEYLVKWNDYDNDTNIWEPYKHLTDTQALDEWEQRRREDHAYLPITDPEPTSYADAIASDESKYWKEAIDKELQSLHDNDTWRLVDTDELPPNRQVIGCKWVFKRKLKADGTIEHYKASGCKRVLPSTRSGLRGDLRTDCEVQFHTHNTIHRSTVRSGDTPDGCEVCVP